MPYEYEEYDECEEDFHIDFFDPGGNSSLRAGVRDQTCPTCGEDNRLTKEDRKLGYQCDSCADQAEQAYRGY